MNLYSNPHYKEIRRILRESKSPNYIHTYLEDHHGIPKCIMMERKSRCKNNPSRKNNLMNKNWNIFSLSAKDHFIIHKESYLLSLDILGKDHIYTQKLLYAWNMFNRDNNGNRIKNIIPEMYQELRILWANRPINKETRLKMGAHAKGKKQSEDHLNKRIESRKKCQNDPNKICGEGNAKAKRYRFTKNDGTEVIHTSLNDYARLNEYSSSALHRLMTGKLNKHKDIIKVERL